MNMLSPGAAKIAEPTALRPLRLPAPEVHHVRTEDGILLRLVRYPGGDAGPVVFSHGNGLGNAIALIDTVECNLAEYLFERGHDVWLFDWRSSQDVDHTQYTLKDAAEYDWAAALKFITGHTGVGSVDCVTFCAAGTTLMMAMAQGHVRGLVRSAVFLQASLLFTSGLLPRLKAGLHLTDIVQKFGWRTYRQGARGASLPYKALDVLLHLYPLPAAERCDNPSCRRMAFAYGEYLRHSRINKATHDRMADLLGYVSLRSLGELGQACTDKQIMEVDDAALDNLRVPITIIQGQDNKLLLPESAVRMHKALVGRHGPGMHQLVMAPDCGHIDSIIGEHAARDIFPFIGAHLDRAASGDN